MRIVWYDTNTNMKTAVITLKEYQGFQRAYDFFNRELFAGSLPQVLEAVRKLMSNKSISYKSLKGWQETDYPVSPFLAGAALLEQWFRGRL
jgi:hypothetical protein